MKNNFIILFLCFTALQHSGELKAQSFNWVAHQSHSIVFNSDYAKFTSATDNKGNSILASIHNFKLGYGLDFFGDISIKKFNPNGTLLYNKILYGKLFVEFIQTDSSGNIYMSGSFMDTLRIDADHIILNTGSGTNVNDFLIKLDANGNFIWKKNININYPGNYQLNTFKVKGNSVFIGIVDFESSFVKKLNLDGNELLSILQSPVRSVSGIDADSEGNIFVAGACSNGNLNFGGNNYSTSYSYNVYFSKYNSSGANLWAKFVEDITFSKTDIVCDNSGNAIACGDLWGPFTFGTITAQGRQWVFDFFLAKINSSGDFLWLREVPHTVTITGDAGKGKLRSIELDNQGNIYFSGFLRGSLNFGNNASVASSGSKDILILKYDSNGNIIYGKRAGGTGNDNGDCISLDNNSTAFISGNFGQTSVFDTITAAGAGSINSFLTKISAPVLPGNINLSAIIEGYYDEAQNKMRMTDTIRLFLRNSAPPYGIIESAISVINENTLTGNFIFNNSPSGFYYLQTAHRNSIETWSSSAVNYTAGSTVNYSFISSASSAFGNNEINVDNSPLRYGVYSGDVNSDGIIDAADMSEIDNDAFNFVSGYYNTDLTGDNIIDASDVMTAANNADNFISKISP